MNVSIETKTLDDNFFTLCGSADSSNISVAVTTAEHMPIPAEISCIGFEAKSEFTVKVDIESYPRIIINIIDHIDGASEYLSFSEVTLERELGLSKKERIARISNRLKKAENKKDYLHTSVIYNGKFMDMHYASWYKKNRADDKQLTEQKNTYFDYMPLISLVVPVYNPNPEHLKCLVRSVLKQSYYNWQLCLVNGSGENTSVSRLISKMTRYDSRIKSARLKNNRGISGNTNYGIGMADGEWIAFADQDDVLEPNAFFEYVKLMNDSPETGAIYCDEDKLDDNSGKHFMPNFKPDFNIDLLLCINYLCHMFMVRKSVIDKIGMLDSNCDGAQDHDFALRCSQVCRISHIPKILYSWRSHSASTAQSISSKGYIKDAGKQAICNYYKSRGIAARVIPTEYGSLYRTDFILESKPLISIIIPNKDHSEDLNRCVESILTQSTYENFEILIIENNSESAETFKNYDRLLSIDSRIRLIKYEDSFNFSAINNLGAKEAKGEYLLLLNNDTELISPDLLESMVGYLQRAEVGIVGAKLLYPDNTIQHAGLLIGVDHAAHHVFLHRPNSDPGYMTRAIASQNLSGVTAACLMVKKAVYEEIGGMNEDFAVAYNDVDFCLKAEKAGYLCVYDAFVAMYHYESQSRGYEQTEEQKERFEKETALLNELWSERLESDPYYNKNLGLRWGYYNI